MAAVDALQLQSLAGLVALPAVALVLRERGAALRAGPTARLVLAGVAVQVAVAGVMLALPGARSVFLAIAGVVEALQAATGEGTALVFGYLGGGPAPFEVTRPEHGFILAFQALPLILLVSALTALLFHWGVLQRVVAGMAWALGRTMGVSGPLATAAAANVFVGMVEAPLFIRPYVARLDRGGLFAVMTVGLATIAGTVLALYAGLVSGNVPDAAGHLVIASVISAPAALMLAQLMVPAGAETPDLPAVTEGPGSAATDPVDAIAEGTRAGVELLLGVVAMLVVFVALVALANQILGGLGGLLGLEITLEGIAGLLFRPLVWLMGVPAAEMVPAAELMGLKTVTNEFVAFLGLAGEAGAGLSERTTLVMTYALAGFANFGSLGILIGGLSAVAPERRHEIVALGPRALVAGTLATMMTGAVIGLLTPP